MRQMRQRPVGDVGVIAREVELGEPVIRVEHAVGMGQPHAIEDGAAVAGERGWRRRLADRAGVAAGAAGAAGGVDDGISRTTSRGLLSSRNPRNAACRITASPVQLAILDLGDKRRLGPMHVLGDGSLRQGLTGRSASHQPIEPRPQIRQPRVAEPGADAAGIAQVALPVVIAEEQRAEPLAAAGGIAEADDDELVAVARI